jgi:catechol 2,3-dioxygenase-like lactoylglutathione lyase family enzyme
MKSITANLIVESIEACLTFYVERLGFAPTAEVTHDGLLGFVILARDGVELMLQSRASLAADIAGVDGEFRVALYLRVEQLAPIRAALEGWPRVVPERTTFYGARELIVRDPTGNLVAFASREVAP